MITPVARSAKELAYLLRCVWDSEVQSLYDPTVLPLKYRELCREDQKLTIGYYLTDSLIDPSHANRSAVLMAKEVLEEQGHTLIELGG